MEFAIALAFNDPSQWPRLARAAEEAGFGAVVLSDHLIYPKDLSTPYPYTSTGKPRWEPSTPWPDPLIAATAMATSTNRLRFILSVYVLTLRHPVIAAKQIGTAALFTGHRLILGVGAGWMREEFDLLGQPFERRGSRMIESIEVMQKLWQGGMVEHEGEFYQLPEVQMSPALDRSVPIWGGGTSEIALRRAARRFDGWASEVQRADEIESIFAALREYRREAGRADEPFGTCVAMRDVFDLEGFRSLAALGVSYLVTVPWLLYGITEDEVERKCEGIRLFGEEIISRFPG